MKCKQFRSSRSVSKEVSVSVIMPAYNAANYISESIRSVQNQTFKNWELIIIDDGSCDDTRKIAHQFQANDQRVECLSLRANKGVAHARNIGTKMARGRYVAFLDADDIWLPNKLEEQLAYMRKEQSVFSFTSYKKITEHGMETNEVVRPPNVLQYFNLLIECPIGNSTVMYDTAILGKVMTPYITNREDYCLWLKIMKITKVGNGLDKVLTHYRKRRNSQSSQKLKLIRCHWEILRHYEKFGMLKSILFVGIWGVKKFIRKFV